MKRIPQINIDETAKLKEITCFALDMDGTVYIANTII